ncbi:nucleotidyltransferase family protein [Saprospiraceae bacterium]|nr:nucleotidyltransferase family protein [Saprospiraceae bacterium]
MKNIYKHIITKDLTVREVLSRLDQLALDSILFLVDENKKLVGALTDGDIRRGLIKGLGLENSIVDFIQNEPKFFRTGTFSLSQMREWRDRNFKIIPVLDNEDQIIDIVNFRLQKSYLPIDGVIMAGGKGTRLRPLTLDTPKPLLKIGDKPIIEYNIDRLNQYGVHNLTITIKYLGNQLIEYFGDGVQKEMSIKYLEEDEPLGTIGAVGLIEHFHNDYILVMNSDLLTNIDFEDLFKELYEKGGDMIVATTPYEVEIPYGVIETNGEEITALVEKPTYTYYSNAGIYIIKKEFVSLIPKNEHFNATDLMETLISNGKKVLHYQFVGYWLDIGKHHDFEKAQKDIKHLNL